MKLSDITNFHWMAGDGVAGTEPYIIRHVVLECVDTTHYRVHLVDGNDKIRMTTPMILDQETIIQNGGTIPESEELRTYTREEMQQKFQKEV